jgi:putative transposase
VVNRGNEKRLLFDRAGAYEEFLGLISCAKPHCQVRVLGYCLMPNHWHLVLTPEVDGAVAKFVHRVCTTHSLRLRRQTATLGLGHIYQRRYHSAVVDSERYYYLVLRYVEANPRRAGLVARARDWPWSSLAERLGADRGLIDSLPLSLPPDWSSLVDEVLSVDVVSAIRATYRQSAPTLLRDGLSKTATNPT